MHANVADVQFYGGEALVAVYPRDHALAALQRALGHHIAVALHHRNRHLDHAVSLVGPFVHPLAFFVVQGDKRLSDGEHPGEVRYRAQKRVELVRVRGDGYHVAGQEQFGNVFPFAVELVAGLEARGEDFFKQKVILYTICVFVRFFAYALDKLAHLLLVTSLNLYDVPARLTWHLLLLEMRRLPPLRRLTCAKRDVFIPLPSGHARTGVSDGKASYVDK